MAVIPLGFGQANLRFTGTGAPTGAEVTFGFSTSGASPTETAIDVIETVVAADLLDRVSAAVTLSSVLVKFGPNETGPSAEAGAAIPGDGAVAQTAPNLAWLVQKSTGAGGRKGRGRMFFPGVPEGSVGVDGVLDTIVAAGFQAQLDLWLAALETAGIGMKLLHSDSTAPTAVEALTLQPVAATQRRRMRR